MQKNDPIFQGISDEGLQYYIKLVCEMTMNLCTPARDDITSLLDFTPTANHFTLSANDIARWNELFGAPLQFANYTYSSPLAIISFLRMVNESGFKLYNIFETGCSAHFLENHPVSSDETYETQSILSSVEKVDSKKHNLIIAKFKTTDSFSGKSFMEIQDEFLITVSNDTDHNKLTKRKKAPVKTPKENELITRIPLPIKHDLAWEYGKISGDINLVHTTKLAKIFGFENPFLQARCVLNLVISKLDRTLKSVLRSVNVKMLKKIYNNSQCTLEIYKTGFLIKDKTQILALGEYSYR